MCIAVSQICRFWHLLHYELELDIHVSFVCVFVLLHHCSSFPVTCTSSVAAHIPISPISSCLGEILL
ncbi:hypothetical protein L6452_08982 [Arctium lappa]|uniref:Uncharacterized protein n=1 Tax=Arctium lappa TaxID=4217 RepID=A0ACB9DJ98_ARCLA|nr:hypothetical protein L6452_08982 [Arctium lappa]